MWQLLKAEIAYNKTFLVLGFILFLTLFVIVVVWGKAEHFVRDVSIALWAATLFGRFSGEIEKTRSKRIRYHTIMPLAVRDIGITRVVFTVLYWVSIILLFLISLLLVKSHWLGIDALWALLPINGLILLGYAGFIIYSDLKSYLMKKSEKIILHTVWFLTVLAGYFLLYYYMDFLGLFTHADFFNREDFVGLYFSTSGVFILNLIALVLSYLSVELFVRRKAYLE
ncbi:MAG: hypothetical protein ACE5HI_13775 [bacterium]